MYGQYLTALFDRNFNYLNNNTLDYLTDTNVAWMCYKSRTTNLVYFFHTKCASTLYSELMRELGWYESNTQEINWENDIVVSHIRNPLIKHRKGIVEALVNYYPEVKEIMGNGQGLKLLSNAISIDSHSMTIHQLLGNNALKVRWIPIDVGIDHKKVTIDLFKHFKEEISIDIEEWFYMLPKLNESTNEEITIFNNLMEITTPPPILRFIDFDMCLYNMLLVPGEPDNFHLRVNQLIGNGLSHSEAVSQADNEVFTLENLKWKFI